MLAISNATQNTMILSLHASMEQLNLSNRSLTEDFDNVNSKLNNLTNQNNILENEKKKLLEELNYLRSEIQSLKADKNNLVNINYEISLQLKDLTELQVCRMHDIILCI